MKKILILNTHSTLNAGDTGIVLAQLKLLREKFPRHQLILTSRTPELDTAFYKQPNIKLLPPLVPAPSIYSRGFQKVYKSLRNLCKLLLKIDLIREIKRCDFVVSSGGGYFWSHRKYFPGPMFFQNYLHLRIASFLKKPVVVFPQSVGPFHSNMARNLLIGAFDSSNILKIYAREKISYNFLQSLLIRNRKKIRLCPDMAFYLEKDTSQKDASSMEFDLPKPIIALTLRQWDFPNAGGNLQKKEKQTQYLNAFEKIGRNIFEKWGGSILVFCQSRGPGNFENDMIVSKRLIENLKKSVPPAHLKYLDLKGTPHPQEIIRILIHMDLLISTRFHSAIFSLIAGTPVIAISYQQKGLGIMKDLDLDRYCRDISALETDEILKICEEILSHPEEIRKKIQAETSNARKKIEATFIDLESIVYPGKTE